jgi:hypothetical protein
LEESAGRFHRPLDLPSSNLRIQIWGNNHDQVTSNLPVVTSDEREYVVVASSGEQLPAGYTIELIVGELPIPWMLYARWGSLVALAALVLVTLRAGRRRSARAAQRPPKAIPGAPGLRPKSKTRRAA